MGRRAVPDGLPRYGFMLEKDGRPVGAILMICQTITHAGSAFVRCNLASWYVDPAFRSHASLLAMVPLRYKNATFLNTSPAPNTWPTIEAQGFVRYTGGQVVALPILQRGARGLTVERFRPTDPRHAAMPDAALLADHAANGCLSLVGGSPEGLQPFVLLPFRPKQGRVWFPGMHVVYCRSLAEIARFARPLGLLLTRIGRPILILDADGPVEGLSGYFWRGRARKYVKGAHRPHLGDLAYTEFTLFGP
jgi:hypothetical protein